MLSNKDIVFLKNTKYVESINQLAGKALCAGKKTLRTALFGRASDEVRAENRLFVSNYSQLVRWL